MLAGLKPPRYAFWEGVLAVIWLLIVLYLGVQVILGVYFGFAPLFFRLPVLPPQGTSYAAPAMLHYLAQQRSYNLALAQMPAMRVLTAFNAWALVAALYLGLGLQANPFRWRGLTRLIVGSMALAVLLGRPLVGWISWLTPDIAPVGWLGALVYLIAPPFLMLLGGSFIISTVFAVIGSVFGFFFALPALLFNQILAFDHNLRMFNYDRQGLAGYITRLGYWLLDKEMPTPPDARQGARLATAEEIGALLAIPPAPTAAAYGHVLTTHPETPLRPLFLDTEKHVLIMASTRSGKGTNLIVPHLLRYPGSAFVLDPKGENARATGRRRAELNDKVHYLDPFGITDKPQSRFNPLTRFTPENMEAESKALAAALITGERDHWVASAQQLFALLLMYVYATPTIPPEQKDLTAVRTLLLAMAHETLAVLQDSALAGGLLADLAASFLKTPERELGSIISTAQRETEILDNPQIRACLAAEGPGEEVRFTDWRDGTMTVYLCLSAPKFPVFSKWLRLVLTSALDEMTDHLVPPPQPVCFMLDELATLGRLQAVENAIGLAAGYGLQLWTVFQDIGQMKDLYHSRWTSFIGNAGVRALFNLDDYDTAAYWSRFLGEHVVEARSYQENIYGLSKGQNLSETLRPLMSADLIMNRFATLEMLILAQGAPPITTWRVPYWRDHSLAGLWDDPRVWLAPPAPAIASVAPSAEAPEEAPDTVPDAPPLAADVAHEAAAADPAPPPPKRRTRLTPAQRQEIVEAVLSGGKTVIEMAQMFNLHPATVGRLVAQARAQA